MKPIVLNRRVHYWASFVVALPLLVMIASGLLLQSKKHWTWVQPAELRGTGSSPVLDFEGVLTAVKQVRAHQVQSWDDVNRLDVRPGRGVVLLLLWLSGLWMWWMPFAAKRRRAAAAR